MKVTHPIFQLPDRNSFTHSSGMLPERATPPHIHTLRPLPPHLHSINHVAFFFFLTTRQRRRLERFPKRRPLNGKAWQQGGPHRPFVPTSPAGRPKSYASSSSSAVRCGPVLVWFPKTQERSSPDSCFAGRGQPGAGRPGGTTCGLLTPCHGRLVSATSLQAPQNRR
jgi:hypothetical protein